MAVGRYPGTRLSGLTADGRQPAGDDRLARLHDRGDRAEARAITEATRVKADESPSIKSN